MSPKAKVIRIALLLVFCWSFLSNVCFGEITTEEIQKIEAAMPSRAPAVPKEPRKLLVFNRCEGYNHSSIPYISKALEIMGQKTGAFAVTESEDMSVFEADNIKQYDAVCFNNCTRLEFKDERLRKSLMDFAKSGKGIIGIHGATDNFYNWPEAAEMMGGLFDGHPWSFESTVWIKVLEIAHPLCRMFDKTGFQITDEIYQLKSPYSRSKLRVLLAIDTNKTDMNKGGIKRKDGDFAISWIRNWGEGRVFYCSLGHNHHIAWDSGVLAHYLAGIQYALGDLTVDASPSGVNLDFFKSTLQKITVYEYGQSREDLTTITELTREAYKSPKVLSQIEQLFLKFLRSDATFAAKQFICRELSIIGTEASVDTLASMLEDAKTADIALYAMQRIPSDSVDTALREMLNKTSGMAKVGVINTIGARKDSKAVSDLASLIRNSDPLIDEAAICALGNIGNSQASEALAKVKERTSGKPGLLALDAYLKCADNFASTGRTKEALAIYEELYNSDKAFPIRSAALRGKVLADKKKAGSVIVNVLKGQDEKMQAIAVGLVKEVQGKKMTKALTKQLPKLSSAVQVQLLSALALRDDRSALPAVTKAAESGETSVRLAALDALGKLGDASTVILLAQTAAQAHDEEQKVAQQSLYSLRETKVDKAIVSNIARKLDPKVKVELIRAVNQRRIGAATMVLLQNTKDSDGQVRVESLKTLKVIAGPEDMSKLADVLVDAQTEIERSEAEKTVVAVANKIEKGDKSGVILSKLKTTDNVDVRCSLIRVLGEIGEPACLGTIRDALTDTDLNVKTAAIRALSEWQSPEPLDDLLKIAKTSSEKTQQILALRGCVKLLALPSSRSSKETSQLYKEVMALAKDTNEKKMVLAGLANMKDVVSLQLAADYLDNKNLQQEAVAAAIKIAKSTSSDNPQQTKDVLKKLSKVTQNESIRKEAFEMLDKIEGYTGYLTSWMVSGPYMKENTPALKLFDVVFAPENKDDTIAVWKIMPASDSDKQLWVLNLQKVLGSNENVAGYLRTKVWSDKAQKLLLELGSDDGIKVWLNYNVVHAKNVKRGLKRGEDVVEVTLKEGWNTLLLKVTQESSGWEACARFRNLDGSKVEGLKVKAE